MEVQLHPLIRLNSVMLRVENRDQFTLLYLYGMHYDQFNKQNRKVIDPYKIRKCVRRRKNQRMTQVKMFIHF